MKVSEQIRMGGSALREGSWQEIQKAITMNQATINYLHSLDPPKGAMPKIRQAEKLINQANTALVAASKKAGPGSKGYKGRQKR